MLVSCLLFFSETWKRSNKRFLDDDGSGSVTILEAMRVLLSDPKIAAGEGANTLEFHWYSGEEAGLLGSQDIFEKYAADGEVVKAMLQQDMTGYGDQPSEYQISSLPPFTMSLSTHCLYQ